jgi:hypothetical protein
MPKVQRPVATGGKPKEVARHIWRGGDDPEMLQKAVKIQASTKPDGTVTAQVTNAGAGHKFPTGIEYHRAILVITATDASGKEVFSKQELFADQRKAGGADTRINPGETRTVTAPTGVTSGTVTAKLIYKRMPDAPEEEATVAGTITMKL